MSYCSEYDDPDDPSYIQIEDSQEIGPLSGIQIHLESQNQFGVMNSFDESGPNLETVNNAIVINDVNRNSVEDSNRNVVPVKAKKKAAVWTCLTELTSGGAKCNFCDKTFKMQDKSTSNAIRHLQSIHPNEQLVKDMIKQNEELQASKKRKREEESKLKTFQPSIANIFSRKGPIDSSKEECSSCKSDNSRFLNQNGYSSFDQK